MPQRPQPTFHPKGNTRPKRVAPAIPDVVVVPDDRFRESDIEGLVVRTRLQLLADVRLDELAIGLTGIVARFVGGTLLQTGAANHGHRAKFLRKLESRTSSLLSDFGIGPEDELSEAPFDGELSAPATSEALTRVIALLEELRLAELEPGERAQVSERIEETVRNLIFLRDRARRVVKQLKANKEALRRIAPPEALLFEELSLLFCNAFGRKWTTTSGGAGMRFCLAVIDLIKDKWKDRDALFPWSEDADRVASLQRILAKLSTETLINDRVRARASGESIRRR